MKKILFVIQRYGENISGGAEWHAREIAEKLVGDYEVEVATTCAIDYTTWANHFSEGEEVLNGVKIRRFRNDFERAKNHAHLEAMLRSNPTNLKANIDWIVGQGPYSSGLFDFLRNNHQNYHKVIIFQYLYTISYYAVKILPPEKIILQPLAHDEPQVEYPIFRELFRKPESFVFNTESEKKLAERVHFIQDKKSVVAGVGIDYPASQNPDSFKKKFGLDKYLIFVGRVDPAKRVDILARDFINYKKNYPSDLKLVFLGKVIGNAVEDKDIIYTGFLPREEDKFDAMAGAVALVNPSPYESLSLILLESFAVKRPAIVNAYCDVLKEHAIKSNGALWYETHMEFDEAVNFLLNNSDKADEMGQNGYNYFREHYDWDRVMGEYRRIIN